MGSIQKFEGLPVVDATTPLPVDVTPRHQRLADGMKGRKTNKSCVAACAIMTGVPGCTEARVHLSRTYVKFGDHWVRYFTPTSVKYEAIAYDKGGKFAPGTYVFPPLHPSERAAYRRKQKQKRRLDGSRPQKRKQLHIIKGIRPRAS